MNAALRIATQLTHRRRAARVKHQRELLDIDAWVAELRAKGVPGFMSMRVRVPECNCPPSTAGGLALSCPVHDAAEPMWQLPDFAWRPATTIAALLATPGCHGVKPGTANHIERGSTTCQ